jgi:hypothetical protein
MYASSRSKKDARAARFSDVLRPCRIRVTWGVLAAAIASVLGSAAIAQTGMLQTIRDDVRNSAPPAPASPPSSDPPADNGPEDPSDGLGVINWPDGASCQNETNRRDGASGPSDESALLGCLIGVGGVVTSPIWVPHVLLEDDFRDLAFFHAYPYDEAPYYRAATGRASGPRSLAVRLDVDYLTTFDRLDSINGRLLVETALRLGLDASWNHLMEKLRDGGHDQLEIGDCNLVYRFAQSDWAEFRAGLGLNWMSDCYRSDVGVNFTYGADLYPRKPWILSATTDFGTLGQAGLFRFRTTAGVVFHGVETYAGYEYTDIGRTHWNGLIGGVGFWF